jgi:hypothetical protein
MALDSKPVETPHANMNADREAIDPHVRSFFDAIASALPAYRGATILSYKLLI